MIPSEAPIIVSGMTMTARHFQGRRIVVLSSRPQRCPPCERPAPRWEPPTLRWELRGEGSAGIRRRLEDVGYNEIREERPDDGQHGVLWRWGTGRGWGVCPSLRVNSDPRARQSRPILFLV